MKILRQDGLGENRTVWIKDGQPWRIVIRRDKALNLGDVVAAKIKAHEPALHGWFAKTARGDVLIKTEERQREGESVRVQITIEAHDEKPATGILSNEPEQWGDSFSGRATEDAPIEDISAAEMDDLMDRAMAADCALAGGGVLHIEHTRIGWAIDVDTRTAGASWRTINQEAVQEIARQIGLKNMGGLILIDFAGSKRGRAGREIEAALKTALAEDDLITGAGWTKAGLYELMRTRRRASLWDNLGNENRLATYYRIRRAVANCRLGRVRVRVAPALMPMLTAVGIAAEPVFEKPMSFFEIVENE